MLSLLTIFSGTQVMALIIIYPTMLVANIFYGEKPEIEMLVKEYGVIKCLEKSNKESAIPV